MKVAVIGVGVMGKNHVRVLSQNKNVKLSAIVDINESVGQEVANQYKTNYYKNHLDLISKDKPDAAILATPTATHKEIAIECIQNGIHLLVEKPIAGDLSDAREIVFKARRKNITIVPGHIERYNPAVLAVGKLVKKGKLGDINSFLAKRVGVYPPRVKDVDVIIDLAVHDLDIICSLADRLPYSVFATGGNSLIGNRKDHAEIFMDFGNFGSFIQVNWITPIKIRSLVINGSKGYVELNYITQDIELYKTIDPKKSQKAEKFDELVKEIQEAGKTPLKLEKSEPLKVELDNFINSIKGREKPQVTGEDAINTLKLAEAVIQSIETGEKVEVI